MVSAWLCGLLVASSVRRMPFQHSPGVAILLKSVHAVAAQTESPTAWPGCCPANTTAEHLDPSRRQPIAAAVHGFYEAGKAASSPSFLQRAIWSPPCARPVSASKPHTMLATPSWSLSCPHAASGTASARPVRHAFAVHVQRRFPRQAAQLRVRCSWRYPALIRFQPRMLKGLGHTPAPRSNPAPCFPWTAEMMTGMCRVTGFLPFPE